MMEKQQVFGHRVRPWHEAPDPGVDIGQVSREMISASKNGWFEDSDDAFFMGYGSGEMGTMVAKATWVAALENENVLGPVGIYVESDPAGYVLLSPTPSRKILGVTLWVHPERRRQGVGTSALSRVLSRVFARGVYRVEVEVLRSDQRAKRFLKRFGFKEEGNRVRSLWMDDRPFDTTLYRLLLPDWEAREDESYWTEEE